MNMLSLEEITRSDTVFDNQFTLESPPVLMWTRKFKNRAIIPQIFQGINEKLQTPSKLNSLIAGTMWHLFSSRVIKLMCVCAGKLSNNEIRHYVIQPIFEELGKRNHRMIHPDIFLDCLDDLDIDQKQRASLYISHSSKLPLNWLEERINSANSDAEILGIMLGLEINAEENILTLSKALSYDPSSKEIVHKSKFFRIHFVAEQEHIRLNVANFLRFCPSSQNKQDFLKGFDTSISFWRTYWNEVTRMIEVEAFQLR